MAAKKIKSKDLLALMEEAFLTIDFGTHYERFKLESASSHEAVNSFKILISDQLMRETRKRFRAYLDED